MLLAHRHRSRILPPLNAANLGDQEQEPYSQSAAEAAESLLWPRGRGEQPDPLARLQDPLIENLYSHRVGHRPSSPTTYRRGWIGKFVLGPGAEPRPHISLYPYRTESGATVDGPTVEMELAKGRDAPPMGYQTKVSKEAIEALQSAFNAGASEAKLFEIAGQFGVGLQLRGIREAVNRRNRDHRSTKFIPQPDTTPTPEPMRPRESTGAYIDRVQGGHFEWTGPYTPSHPTGRNTDEQLRAIFAPFAGQEEAERLSTAAQTLIPPLGAMQAAEDGWAAARSGRPVAALGNATVAAASLFPPLRSASGQLRIIDAAALRRASSDGAIDVAREVRSAVENGLAEGAKVTFHSGRVSRSIVGTDKTGSLIDERGRVWGLPRSGERVEIRIPASGAGGRNISPPQQLDAGFGATVPPPGRSTLLGGPKSLRSRSAAGVQVGAGEPLGVDLRPTATRDAARAERILRDGRAEYDPNSLWDERFANLRYELPGAVRQRLGGELSASLERDSSANLAFQRQAWPTLGPAVIDRSLTGPALVSLDQMFRPDRLELNGFPLSRDFLAATGNIRDVLETVARQHPDQLPRIRDLGQLTIADPQLHIPRLRRKGEGPILGLPGEFSLVDKDYPLDHVWLPPGPLRLISGDEYYSSSRLKANFNDRLRNGFIINGKIFEIHEPHPIKFNGDPEDLMNRLLVHRDPHRQIINSYWGRRQAYLERLGRLR
jgi:hypothetical protein